MRKIKEADFVISKSTPRLENIKTYQPGEQRNFYEGHAFSPDDKKILFSANLVPAQQVTGLDTCELDLDTLELVRLTTTLDDWDEHAHYSPDGSRIAWMSSTGYQIDYASIKGHEWAKDLVTEL